MFQVNLEEDVRRTFGRCFDIKMGGEDWLRMETQWAPNPDISRTGKFDIVVYEKVTGGFKSHRTKYIIEVKNIDISTNVIQEDIDRCVEAIKYSWNEQNSSLEKCYVAFASNQSRQFNGLVKKAEEKFKNKYKNLNLSYEGVKIKENYFTIAKSMPTGNPEIDIDDSEVYLILGNVLEISRMVEE